MHDPHLGAACTGAFAYNTLSEDFFSALNTGLQHIALPQQQRRSDLPIVYIVGAPRTGTTLLSQLISRHLDVGYVSNILARFWARPSVGVFLSQAILGDNPDAAPAFESTHGRTANPAGPHEFGYFWRHWLRLDACRTHHLTPEDIASVDAPGLTRALEEELLGASGKPFVFKTVVAGFCARFLTQIHPRSLFVYVDRNARDVARSLLRCRMERYGNYHTWWSLKPSTWPFACDTPGEEAALQVTHCCAEILDELNSPSVNSIHLTYQDICTDPQGVLERIRSALQPWGIVPAMVRDDFRPFAVHHEPPLDAQMEADINKVLRC